MVSAPPLTVTWIVDRGCRSLVSASSAATGATARAIEVPSRNSRREMLIIAPFYEKSGTGSLLYPAVEILGLVRAAGAFIKRNLRIRTERARPFDLIARVTRRRDRIRCLVLFYPLLQRGDSIEPIGAIAAAAVRHSRHHEQPVRPAGLVSATKGIRD